MQTILAVVTDLFFAVKVIDAGKRAGREVKFARSVAQALALAGTVKPVLIVADLHCKEVDCLELARQIRLEPELSDMPLLGFVSHVQEDLRRAALAAGFSKVVARSTFSDKVRELLADGMLTHGGSATDESSTDSPAPSPVADGQLEH